MLRRGHLEMGPKAVDLLVLRSQRPDMVLLGSGTRIADRSHSRLDV